MPRTPRTPSPRLRSRLPFPILLAFLSFLGACTKEPAGPPDEAVRRLNVGIAYLEQHRFGQAEKELLEAVKADDRYVEGHVDLGIAYAAQVK